ncbi:MAG: SNF2-related protein [Verrucomicrobia bacterium]|nr:SNF2-related protein [Verrucomicrobiota bacterium]
MTSKLAFRPGQRVEAADLGQGVVVESPGYGHVRVFFPDGERSVPASALRLALSREESIVQHAAGGDERQRRAWLCYQAYRLPLMESAASLTSAKIDLLPHQIVLTHRVATTSPRRFLVADEVGLGKTIEAALMLRELAGRGELKRALMVVPAGLVNNWHRELNEVFHLNFEVFGHTGDVTDRRTNAFARHDLLIASIDTLKQAARMRRIENAPDWDLVVFDEAHHLTAYKNGGKITKTQNYKLAELLRKKARDLILLSATPHQGDHFRFWMLVKLLDPTLFEDPQDMLAKRHRLNSVVFRRTKADACRPDGSPLFARRWVHTESFLMSPAENAFYLKLTGYLAEGFALARRQGSKGRSLGFVMTIFQKISASSFAAVQRTLRRRLIALAVHEGLVHEGQHEIEKRNAAWAEARTLLREEYGLGSDRRGDAELEKLFLDLKRKLLKKMDEDDLALASDEHTSEATVAAAEEVAVTAVEVCLPEERRMIREVLALAPAQQETKVGKLLGALQMLWEANPAERMVIFATYLGSVEMLEREIDAAFPGKGVVTLRGGDHGSKLAAERRFKQADGPRVMICTAAGREGINLQHARVLFNFDLPFNPMDIEQRIGRIHRYGQRHTAQVYNLVLSDTIEGSIFLLLEDKLVQIAKTLGKLDEHGNVAEDLRSQILGQLSEGLKYQQLYAEALADPELHRTRQELEVAMENATVAREAVFELFQDLDGFSLEDYQPLAEREEDRKDIIGFAAQATTASGGNWSTISPDRFSCAVPGETELVFTTDREQANASVSLELLGLDHPFVANQLRKWQSLPPEELGLCVQSPDGRQGVLSVWRIESRDGKGRTQARLVSIACGADNARIPTWEKKPADLFCAPPVSGTLRHDISRMTATTKAALLRELEQRGLAGPNRSYSADVVGWIECYRILGTRGGGSLNCPGAVPPGG